MTLLNKCSFLVMVFLFFSLCKASTNTSCWQLSSYIEQTYAYVYFFEQTYAYVYYIEQIRVRLDNYAEQTY